VRRLRIVENIPGFLPLSVLRVHALPDRMTHALTRCDKLKRSGRYFLWCAPFP
jgi:hypothetical protein